MEKWAEHPEGKECKRKIDDLLKKLNTDILVKEWEKEMNTGLKTNDLSKKQLFRLVKKNKYEIGINFEKKYISLIKEIKSFDSIQTKKLAMNVSRPFIELYPNVVSLKESIHSYYQVSAKIDQKILKLVAEKKKRVMQCIDEGFHITWN